MYSSVTQYCYYYLYHKYQNKQSLVIRMQCLFLDTELIPDIAKKDGILQLII